MVVVKLALWDFNYPTTGCIDPSNYNDASAFILVFDLYNQQSFEILNIQVRTIHQNFSQCPIYIVGNKNDLINELEGRISEESILQWVRENNIDAYFKVSARTGENVSRVFEILTQTLVQNQINMGMSVDNLPPHFKIIIEGLDNVGKTSIIRRLLIERGVPEDQAQYFKETYDVFVPISKETLTYPTDLKKKESEEQKGFGGLEKEKKDLHGPSAPPPAGGGLPPVPSGPVGAPGAPKRPDSLRNGMTEELKDLFKAKSTAPVERIYKEEIIDKVMEDLDQSEFPASERQEIFGELDDSSDEEEEDEFSIATSGTAEMTASAPPKKKALSPMPKPPEPEPKPITEELTTDSTTVRRSKSKKKQKIEGGRDSEASLISMEEKAVKYTKNLSVEYFDRMNPENYYPLTLDIANIKQAVIATRENVVTGERFTQKQEKVEVELNRSEVTVRPIFPGCVVTPPELTADFKKPQEALTFFITPLVKGNLDECRIDLLDYQGRVFYELMTPAKVDDPRIARAIATYGTFIGIFPKLLGLFDIDIGAVNSTPVGTYIPPLEFLGPWNMANFISVMGATVAVIIGLIVHRAKQPKSTIRTFQMSDLAGYLGELI